MITKLSHAVLYVDNHEKAKAFYTETLGFEVRTDITMEGFRWLTVGPTDQPGLEISLMEINASPMLSEENAAQMRKLLAAGAIGAGVFETKDCKKTYEELKAKGVEFLSEPKEMPYGVEATFKDNSGNWFSLTQRPG